MFYHLGDMNKVLTNQDLCKSEISNMKSADPAVTKESSSLSNTALVGFLK